MVALTDTAIGAIELALHGLNTRADVAAHNIANLNPPGYRASRVGFQAALRDALDTGRMPGPGAGVVTEPGDGLPDATGNTVDLETEMVGMMTDNLLRDAMVNAFNHKAGVLRAAISGR